ncbi:MAG: GWxTD domain-containing protein [Candidatus Cloacimonetes bacterium]|nr:GWxTD domain-containing protein [Candidatus Cloacimonadota bacterium]
MKKVAFVVFFITLITNYLNGVFFLHQDLETVSEILIISGLRDMKITRGQKSTQNVEIIVQISNPKKKLVWNNRKKMSINTHVQENFFDLYIPIFITLPLEKGKYKVFVEIINKTLNEHLVEEFDFYRKKSSSTIGQPYFSFHSDGIEFLYSKDYISEPDTLNFRLSSSVKLKKLFYENQKLPLDEKESNVFIAKVPLIDSGEFPVGITVKGQENEFKLEINPFSYSFFVKRKYSPSDQLSQLRSYLSQEQLQRFSELEGNELQKEIDNFWDQNNPVPGSYENPALIKFYRRVDLVDRKFGITGYLPGWRTDRGRIYLKYGEPDETESNVLPLRTDPVIIWRYYEHRKVFRFYDKRGFGNYELENKWNEWND